LKKFTDSSMLQNRLGHLYENRGNRDKAKEHFLKGVKIAVEKKDSKLEKYQQDHAASETGKKR